MSALKLNHLSSLPGGSAKILTRSSTLIFLPAEKSVRSCSTFDSSTSSVALNFAKKFSAMIAWSVGTSSPPTNPALRCKINWCGRPDLNRHSSFEPRDFHTTSAFAALPGRVRAFGSFVVWTIPSPSRVRALGAARLVSTPSRRSFDRSAWLGIACYRFPRIWAVLHLRFPGGHSICSSPLRLPISPRPRTDSLYSGSVSVGQELLFLQ